MYSVAVLERIFDEASALLHYHDIPSILHCCGIFKTTRNESNVCVIAQASSQVRFTHCAYGPMQIAYDFKEWIVLTENFVHQPLGLSTSKLVEFFAPYTIDAVSHREDAMRMEAEEGALFLNVFQGSSE